MIFLTSDGLSSPQLVRPFLSAISNTSKRCAIIPTAMEKDLQKDIWLKETVCSLGDYGIESEIFYLGQRDTAQLKNFDIIYLCGGNVFYLMDVMNNCGCREIFPSLCQEKIVVGVSAGSLVMQKDLVLIKELIPRMNKRIKLKDLSALDLTGDVEHLPHKTRYTENIDAFEKRIKTYERKVGHKVVCLEDGQGIVIENGQAQFIE